MTTAHTSTASAPPLDQAVVSLYHDSALEVADEWILSTGRTPADLVRFLLLADLAAVERLRERVMTRARGALREALAKTKANAEDAVATDVPLHASPARRTLAARRRRR